MNASVNESAAPGSLFAEALPGGAVCKGDVCRGSMWHPGIEDDPATIPRYTLQVSQGESESHSILKMNHIFCSRVLGESPVF